MIFWIVWYGQIFNLPLLFLGWSWFIWKATVLVHLPTSWKLPLEPIPGSSKDWNQNDLSLWKAEKNHKERRSRVIFKFENKIGIVVGPKSSHFTAVYISKVTGCSHLQCIMACKPQWLIQSKPNQVMVQHPSQPRFHFSVTHYWRTKEEIFHGLFWKNITDTFRINK